MADVFVSRPTWVGPSFRSGLEGFLGLLGSMGLNPRTIGATDYPNRAPLDEVIRLMDRCAGAVILGYPQIVVTAGMIKEQPFSTPLSLPTEWNHIEAGLAYARRLPLLVIHHITVCRGIFDRGAISSFIYEVNLEDAAWPLSPNVRGAVETWRRDVLEPHAGTHALGDPSTGRAAVPQVALSDAQVKLLKILANEETEDVYFSADDIADRLGTSGQKVRYYLDGLVEGRYVERSLAMGRPVLYYLGRAGRRLLVERGLL